MDCRCALRVVHTMGSFLSGGLRRAGEHSRIHLGRCWDRAEFRGLGGRPRRRDVWRLHCWISQRQLHLCGAIFPGERAFMLQALWHFSQLTLSHWSHNALKSARKKSCSAEKLIEYKLYSAAGESTLCALAVSVSIYCSGTVYWFKMITVLWKWRNPMQHCRSIRSFRIPVKHLLSMNEADFFLLHFLCMSASVDGLGCDSDRPGCSPPVCLHQLCCAGHQGFGQQRDRRGANLDLQHSER